MTTKQAELSYLDPFMEAFRPPEDLTVAEWAEREVMLPALTCPYPGRLKLSRTPYAKGPLEAFNSPHIEWIVLVFGRQTGKSQGVMYPCMGYGIAQDPGPMMLVLPTNELAEYTSTNRLQPMFEETSVIKKKKTDNRHDYTTLEMKFRDMILSIVGGGSSSQLMSRPIRYLFRDEIDELKENAGNSTDPLKTSEETTTAFWNRKILDTSTPTVPEGHIWQSLRTCQYVFECWVPCPHCGAYQILLWEQVKFNSKETDREKVASETYYECEHCRNHIFEAQKEGMLNLCEWRARLIDDPCQAIIEGIRALIEETIPLGDALQDHRIKKIGFHLPKWYGNFYFTTFGEAAKLFLEAHDAMKDRGDYTKMRDWTKFWRAIPWKNIIETKNESQLMDNIIDLPALICPPGTVALTMGIDPGQSGYWFVVVAWQRDLTCHVIRYGFTVDPEELRRLCWETAYQIQGTELYHSVWKGGMDTGGGKYAEKNVTMTEDAYNWLRAYGSGKVVGTKGSSHPMQGKKIKEHKIDRMPGENGKPIPGGVIVWELDTDAFKDLIFYRLNLPEGTPGRLTFHAETTKDFTKHLTAEVKERDSKTGAETWIRKSRMNHYFDCLVEAFALADQERGGIRVQSAPPQTQVKPSFRRILNPGMTGFIDRFTKG